MTPQNEQQQNQNPIQPIGGKETVIGIASSGDADCKTYGRNMRIDAFLPFLKGFATSILISDYEGLSEEQKFEIEESDREIDRGEYVLYEDFMKKYIFN